MEALFSQILQMSLIASIVIGAVLLCRLALRRAPRIFVYALWAVVLLRLLCPVAIESDLSLLQLFQPVRQEVILSSPEPAETITQTVTSPLVEQQTVPSGQLSPQAVSPWTLLSRIWLAGVLVVLAIQVLSLLRLRRQLVGRVHLQGNLYQADHIRTSFVLGVIRPKIYLPSGLSAQEQQFMLQHEQTHIRRLDPLTRVLAAAALCLHWFNPLVWLAFVLSEKDMELACDEAVVSKLQPQARSEYAALLLRLTAGSRPFRGPALAFGKRSAKERIARILQYHKPAVWASLLAGVVVVVAAVLLITNPAEAGNNQIATIGGADGPTAIFCTTEEPLETATSQAILQQTAAAQDGVFLSSDCVRLPDGLLHCESHVTLTVETEESADDPAVKTTTVYALVLEETFQVTGDTLTLDTGSCIPTAITFTTDDDGNYQLQEYWIPRDGSLYASDIQAKFPADAAKQALDLEEYSAGLTEENLQKAQQAAEIGIPGQIAALLAQITASPAASSAPGDYIAAHEAEYTQLVSYGNETLRYCFTRFLAGGEYGLEGHIMAIACRDILQSQGAAETDVLYETGQAWFDNFYANALQLKSLSDEQLQSQYPAAWLLLSLAGEV